MKRKDILHLGCEGSSFHSRTYILGLAVNCFKCLLVTFPGTPSAAPGTGSLLYFGMQAEISAHCFCRWLYQYSSLCEGRRGWAVWGEIAEWVGLCPKKGPFYTGHWGPKQSGNKTRAGRLLFLDTREGFCVFESCCVWVSRHSAESTGREEAPVRVRGHEQLDWAAAFIFAKLCLPHCRLRGLLHVYWVPSIKQGAFLSRFGIIFLSLRWLSD